MVEKGIEQLLLRVFLCAEFDCPRDLHFLQRYNTPSDHRNCLLLSVKARGRLSEPAQCEPQGDRLAGRPDRDGDQYRLLHYRQLPSVHDGLLFDQRAAG